MKLQCLWILDPKLGDYFPRQAGAPPVLGVSLGSVRRRCKVSRLRLTLGIIAAVLGMVFGGWVRATEEIVLFDPAQVQDVATLKISGTKAGIVTGDLRTIVDKVPGQPTSGSERVLSSKRILLQVAPGANAAGLELSAGERGWDLSAYRFLAAELRNASDHPVRVYLSARSRTPKGRSLSRQIRLGPGESYFLRLTLRRTVPAALEGKFFGMRGFPALMDPERGIDVSQIVWISVGMRGVSPGAKLEIGRVVALGSADLPDWAVGKSTDIFPIIDRFGQYIQADWPRKTKSEEDLRNWAAEEKADLEANPGPSDWNRYGGWVAGPNLKATGHFYPTKVGGKWWLVDPEGRLFWSHGVDCVRSVTATTPITDRLHYFAELPPRDGPFGVFFGRASWAPHGYYQNKGPYETFCFSGANLLRKYGPEWSRVFTELAHVRLRSWGLNTIGNWSDPEVYRLSRTPYVVTLGTGRRPIEGSTGYWGKFPDPFDPDFVTPLRKAMEGERARSAQDPWCLGYFVDNELSWGDELSLAIATLQSPRSQPAKQVFVEELQRKYEKIEALNAAWGSDYPSWEALLESTAAPDRTRAREDLAAFTSRIASEYFRRIREVLKAAAPEKLYLGCRFAWVNERAIRAAAEFCDVISFNRYDIDLAEFRLPEGIDRPVIIGEFHFGALDRGMFHTGLQEAATQAERAELYRRYVLSALDHPMIVGTHWFQFQDQATTGRGDGENYQIGFVDVCDTPYPELVAASREIGRSMYSRRLGAEANSR